MPASQYEGPMSLWSALDGIITVDQAREIAVRCQRTLRRADRWINRCENRLAYERAMLGEQGGIVADRVKPEKGGVVKCWVDHGHSSRSRK